MENMLTPNVKHMAKRKKGKDEETKGKRNTHGTKERINKYSRGRIKLKVSEHWTKKKCHSAGQRILDDDDTHVQRKIKCRIWSTYKD